MKLHEALTAPYHITLYFLLQASTLVQFTLSKYNYIHLTNGVSPVKLIHAIDEFYYELILKNLRAMNKDEVYGNLTYNSLLYVEIIMYNKNCTPSFLADTLHVARSAVTVKINELVAKGIVIKTPSDLDKRVTYLSVSPEVSGDYKLIDESLTKAIDEIETRFSSNEISAFTEMLHIIKKHYQVDSRQE